MVRTIVFLLLAVVALGALLTPGVAGLGVILLILLLGAVVWWTGLAVVTRGRPSESVARTKRPRLLGPGGPDDPFADEPYDGEEEAAGHDAQPQDEESTEQRAVR